MTVIYPQWNAGTIINSKYEIIKKVSYTPTYATSNMHDFNVVKNGTRALVLTKYRETTVSKAMSKVVGFDGRCRVHMDGLKELDITGDEAREIFAWNGTDHIGLDETTFHPRPVAKTCLGDWDIHHFNAIDQFPDGDYLLSSRHTSTIYKISHKDGSIVWRLGGVKSDFQQHRNAKFSRQHHARVHSQNKTHTVVSLFNNALGTGNNERPSNSHSCGLVLELDTVVMTAQAISIFDHPRGGFTNSRGSNQVLPNGNGFVGWAYHTLISEHASDGRILMEARLKKNIHTYRAYKFQWVGHPPHPPNVVSAAFVAGNHTSTIAYVSWNGATEVRRWNLYQTDERGSTKRFLSSVAKKGFETRLSYEGYVHLGVVLGLC